MTIPLLFLRIFLFLDFKQGRQSFVHMGIFEFLPVLRLLKMLRRFQKFHLLTNAFKLASEALPVLIYWYLVIWLLFSAGVYAVEPRSNVASLSQAMWMTFVSMTTVGYGDSVPKSNLGRAVVMTLVIISALYMAIP